MLIPARVHDDGLAGRHVLNGQVEQMVQHALAQNHLGGQRPMRATWPRIDHEMDCPR